MQEYSTATVTSPSIRLASSKSASAALVPPSALSITIALNVATARTPSLRVSAFVEQIGGREQAPYDIRSVAPNDLTLALKWPDPILNRAPLGGGQFGESLSMFVRLNAALCGVVIAVACSSAARAESGIASIYAYAGEKTANGERAKPDGLTAAHRTLPFGTRVRVTNKRN